MQLLDVAKNQLNKFYNPTLYKAPERRELTEEERIYVRETPFGSTRVILLRLRELGKVLSSQTCALLAVCRALFTTMFRPPLSARSTQGKAHRSHTVQHC